MEKMELLANTLHTLLCDLPHESDMQKFIENKTSGCNYYLEETITEFWQLPNHKFWMEEAEQIKNDLKASNAQEALRSIYRVLDLVEKTNDLTSEEFDFFTRLLQLSDASSSDLE